MKRAVVTVFLALFAAVALPGCGKDDGTGPGDGNGGGETIVLSAETSDGWTCHFDISEHTGSSCTWRGYVSERIGDFWIPGGFRVVTQATWTGDCCNDQEKRGTITSGKIDLSGYETVRLKTHATFHADCFSLSGELCEVHATLHSNVPNTPDLVGVIDEHFRVPTCPTTIEKDIDVSLENAIGYKEATIEIRFRMTNGCARLVNEHSVELGNFRIVGTR